MKIQYNFSINNNLNMKYISIASILTVLILSSCSQNQQTKINTPEKALTPTLSVFDMSRDFTENFNEAKDKYMNTHVILKGFVHEKFKTADDHCIVIMRGFKVDENNVIQVMDGMDNLYLSEVECMLSADSLFDKILDKYDVNQNLDKSYKHINSQIITIEGDIKDISQGNNNSLFSKFGASFHTKMRKCKVISLEQNNLTVNPDQLPVRDRHIMIY